MFQEFFYENGFEDDNEYSWVRQRRILERKQKEIDEANALKKKMRKDNNSFGMVMGMMALKVQ